MKKSKTKKLLDEASYYTGAQTGSQAPETTSAYEFAKDSVPTINKLGGLENAKDGLPPPQALPFPLQNTLVDLADIYIKTQGLRNKAREASVMPLFRGKEAEIKEFRRSLNGIMVECKKLAAKLQNFTLAPLDKRS